ncbi:MAG: SHOCT domain-containing protein [Chloroflexi bacterium]|nr:SHOCT domain-containing protein [Chloroflexota bacterium]
MAVFPLVSTSTSGRTGRCSWHRAAHETAGGVAMLHGRRMVRVRCGAPCPIVPLAIGFAFFTLVGSTVLFSLLLLAAVVAATIGVAVLLARVLLPLLHSVFVDRPHAPRVAPPRFSSRLARDGVAPMGMARVPGPRPYQRELLELLKERFVRGEITVAELERRAAQIVRDPSVRHLA